MNNTKENFSTCGGFTQQLRNLPQMILDLPRFLSTRKDNHKAPANSKWQLPENQRQYSKLRGVRGFVAATEQEGGFLFLDFDHATDTDGKFVNAEAERWYNNLRGNGFFCERSQSNTGLHMFALPTAGKFGKVVGKIYFDADKKSFLEVFYGTTKFCLPTGNLFHCEPKANIATGEAADVMLQMLIDELEKQKQPHAQEPHTGAQSGYNASIQPQTSRNHTSTDYPDDTPEYNQFRAKRMLDVIPTAELEDKDWLAVQSVCKNENVPYEVVDSWNYRDQERYNKEGNKARWDSLNDPSFDIETLHGIAKRFGYSEADSRREWYAQHAEISIRRAVSMNSEQTRDNNAPRTRDKISDCPVDLEIPDNFLFGKGGITLVEPPRKVNGAAKYICAARTPIVPTKKFREPTTGTVEYEIAILSDGEWCTTEIEGRALADPRAISKLCDKGALIDEPKLICRFLNATIAQNPSLPKIKAVKQTGWDDDFDIFAFPMTDGSTVIRRTGYNYERIFKPRGDADKWIQKFQEVTEQGGTVARVVIGATCAASLVRPLELPNLQVHVHGRKSIGKTPLLKFACSVYGDSNIGALATTFAASPKSRLEMAAAFRDLPFIVEELESIRSREAEKLPQDIYNFSLGSYPGALNNDGTKREEKPFSGTRLTTGEHSLVQQHGNAGEFKRVLELRCSDLLDEDFAADLHGFCNHNRGLFGAQWIRYILKKRDVISKQYHQVLKAVKTAQRDSNAKNDSTQLQTLIIAAVTYQHFKLCLGLQSEINNEEINADIADVIANLPTATEIDDTQRFIEELRSFVAGQTAYFVREGDSDNDNSTVEDFYSHNEEGDFTQRALERYGKIFANGEVAILYPHAFRVIAEDKLKFKSADKLVAELDDKGYLRTSDKRHTFSTWISGKTARTIRFKAGVICAAKTALEQDNATKSA